MVDESWEEEKILTLTLKLEFYSSFQDHFFQKDFYDRFCFSFKGISLQEFIWRISQYILLDDRLIVSKFSLKGYWNFLLETRAEKVIKYNKKDWQVSGEESFCRWKAFLIRICRRKLYSNYNKRLVWPTDYYLMKRAMTSWKSCFRDGIDI